MSKKIIIVLPNLQQGGVEKIRIALAQEFISKDYEVEFCLLKAEGEFLNLVPRECKIVNLNVHKYRNLLFPLAKYFKKSSPDAILSAMWPLSILTIWAHKLSGINANLIVSEHNYISSTPVYHSDRKGINRYIIPFTMKYSYPYADYIIGVSKGVISNLKEISGLPLKNSMVIYNPAAPDIKKVKKLKANRNLWNSKISKKIIGIGSLKKQKDFPNLIKAFALITKDINAELLILGEGEERKKLEQLINDRNLEDSVHLPGFIQEPLQYLKSADLFVLSSAWEGLGNVLIEALACGVPVVSTDCKSGPREILDNGKYGELVPVGDPEALAFAIFKALEKEHDVGKLIERSQYFSVEKAAKKYLELLFPDVYG